MLKNNSMLVGDCKDGDVVWIIDRIWNEIVQIEICEDCDDTQFLMPRKKIKCISTKKYPFVDLFYSQKCYKTKEEAESVLNETKHQDHTDAIDTLLTFTKDKEFDCMKRFIRHLEENNVISKTEYAEFKERSINNLTHGELLEEFLNYGQ